MRAIMKVLLLVALPHFVIILLLVRAYTCTNPYIDSVVLFESFQLNQTSVPWELTRENSNFHLGPSEFRYTVDGIARVERNIIVQARKLLREWEFSPVPDFFVVNIDTENTQAFSSLDDACASIGITNGDVRIKCLSSIYCHGYR